MKLLPAICIWLCSIEWTCGAFAANGWFNYDFVSDPSLLDRITGICMEPL
jgi:hypothetical protein